MRPTHLLYIFTLNFVLFTLIMLWDNITYCLTSLIDLIELS